MFFIAKAVVRNLYSVINNYSLRKIALIFLRKLEIAASFLSCAMLAGDTSLHVWLELHRCVYRANWKDDEDLCAETCSRCYLELALRARPSSRLTRYFRGTVEI